MGKSSKKSTPKVEAVPAVAPLQSGKKGKREAEETPKKQVVVKKLKKNNGVAQAIVKNKVEVKAQKKKKKKDETSISSDDSSDSEDEPAPLKKQPTIAKNGSVLAKKAKQAICSESSESSSEDDSSSDEEPPQKATLPTSDAKNVPSVTAKGKTASSDNSSEEDSDEEESDDSEDEQLAAKKSKVDSDSGKDAKVVKKVNSSEEEESEESSDDDEESDEEETPKKPQKIAKQQDLKSGKKAPQTPATPQVQSTGSKTLFIGNLSFQIEQDDVNNFFKDAGEIVEIRFSTDAEGNFKGYGHVEFATAEAAQKALELNGESLMNRPVRLDLARERGAYTPQSGDGNNSFQKGGRGQARTIFVKGFDQSLGQDEIKSSLEEHFGSCGEISRVAIPVDRETGAVKGFAYLDFNEGGSLNKALELDGSELNNYTLSVDEAKPKGEFRDGPGSGRGGGRSGGRGRSGGSRGGRGGWSGGRDGGGRGGRGGRRGGGRFGGGGRGR